MRLSTASFVIGLFSSCASLLTAATADPPVFSPVPSSALAPLTIVLSSPTPGAEVRATIDGSEPTATSPLVGAGITVAPGVPVVIRARTFAAGYDPSPLRAARYQVGPRVVAGRYHSLALTTTGTVEAWGRGTAGQLGDGTTADRWMGRTVTGLSNVVELAAGGDFSAAVTADGHLWTWGRNDLGMLGLGDTTNRSIPTQVAIAGVRSVACGESALLVLMQDGTVISCGSNDMGQLGDGTDSNASTLQVVPELTDTALNSSPAVTTGLATGRSTTLMAHATGPTTSSRQGAPSQPVHASTPGLPSGSSNAWTSAGPSSPTSSAAATLSAVRLQKTTNASRSVRHPSPDQPSHWPCEIWDISTIGAYRFVNPFRGCKPGPFRCEHRRKSDET